jgi:hypothetical protein
VDTGDTAELSSAVQKDKDQKLAVYSEKESAPAGISSPIYW